MVQWKAANREYFADLDDDVTYQEYLHLPSAHRSSFPVGSQNQIDGYKDGNEGDEDGAKVGQVSASTEGNAIQDTALIRTSWRLVAVHEEL